MAVWSSALLSFLLGTRSGMVNLHTASSLPPLLHCYSATAFNYLTTELEAVCVQGHWVAAETRIRIKFGQYLVLNVWGRPLPRVR